jgi:hypothetical protein
MESHPFRRELFLSRKRSRGSPTGNMKIKLFVLALLAAGPLVASSNAGTREEEAIRALRGVPPPELPAVAAQIVASAPAESRGAIATVVLQAVSQRTPSSAPAVRTALIDAGVLPPSVNVPPPAAPRIAAAATPVTPPSSGGQVTTPNGNSRFPTAPPHGGVPPGHAGQPDRKGPPPFVDYTKPRSF